MAGNAPRHYRHAPPGHVPGSQFADTGDPFGMKLGIITHVDEVHMKANVRIITGSGEREELDLTQAMVGPRSFLGGIPEVNSLVIIGYRRVSKKLQIAMILGYLPVSHRSGVRFDPTSTVNPDEIDPDDEEDALATFGGTTRNKRLKLSPGDVGGMSSAGSEFVLSKDVTFTNRAGDLIELRDSDRTLVTQAIHRVEAASGVHTISGPIRRGDFWLPPDILQSGVDTPTLRTTDDRYFGGDVIKAAGLPNSKFANSSGVVLDIFNDANEFPPTTYTNSRQVFYPTDKYATAFESTEGLGSSVYVEHRMELAHNSDLSQEVISEIDGFRMDRRQAYIEMVLGTIVGNDLFNATDGQRNYGKILRPVIFDDFWQRGSGSFRLEAVDQTPQMGSLEADSVAGAALLKIRSPRTPNPEFAAAVTKQGQLLLNVPGGAVSKYTGGARNMAAELNFGGGVKVNMGATSPDGVSMHYTSDGGVVLDLGADQDGTSLTIIHHGAIKYIHNSTRSSDDTGGTGSVALQQDCDGDIRQSCASLQQTVASATFKCDGVHDTQADKVTVHALSGHSINAGEVDLMCSGKSQYNYALQVLENIALGGKVSTILAGGLVENIVAGAVSQTISGGAKSTSVAAGAYSVTVGTGAMSFSTGAGAVTLSTSVGVMSISADAGPISISGLAISITATTLLSMDAPLVLIGGATAVLGVCRGAPALPPGTPSLCYITGLPLLGAATVLSK
jgi:hypothetical protein